MTHPRCNACLWFHANAEAAARRYCELIPDSRIVSISRHGPNAPLPEGTELLVSVELGGVLFWFLNAGPHYTLNEAASIVVHCDDQPQLDRIWNALLDGGHAMACGWLTDRWGVSWQVLPARLESLLSGPNAGRVMEALMGMVKIDIGALEAAAAG